ncbi:MAG: FAD-binding protein [Coriobacteriales bacterium]|jgi:succinate dehydrogenase/fumarate reductase flavoprotein subunit
MERAMGRREFIGVAGPAAAMVGIGAGSLATNAFGKENSSFADGEQTESWEPATWTESADAVVIGYGTAGAVAAMTMADAGLKVILLEKADEENAGGETCVSGGYVMPNPGAGDGLTEDAFLVSTLNTVDRPYAEFAVPIFNETPDYVSQLGLNLDTTTLPGLAFAASDYNGCGGYALYEALEAGVEKRSDAIEVLYETPATGLVQNPATGEVIGVRAGFPDDPKCFEATRGVVVACGGYEADREMVNAINAPGLLFPTVSSPFNTGDGIKMLMKAGAKTQNFGKTLEFCDLSFKVASESVGTAICLGQGIGAEKNAFSDGYVFVNRQGKRFMDEKTALMHNKNVLAINDFTGNAFSDGTNTGYPNVPAFLVFDEATRVSGPLGRRIGDGGWGWNTGYPGKHNLYTWSDDNQAEIDAGWIVKADTLEELAQAVSAKDLWGNDVSIDADGLVATIKEYNDACEAGSDPDFNRDPATLVALGDGPYYAAEMSLTTIYTTGGPLHDTAAQVLDWDENPIPRLFAAGEVADVYNVHSPSLVGAMSWGRVAGENIAKLSPRR